MAVLSLTWKSPYVDKTVFILRRGPGPVNIRNSIFYIVVPTDVLALHGATSSAGTVMMTQSDWIFSNVSSGIGAQETLLLT